MRQAKVFEYHDPLNDDFAATQGIEAGNVPADFPFVRQGFWWRLFAFAVYRLLATPLVFVYCKLRYGLLIRGRRQLKGVKGGFFLCGNHTQYEADAFIPTLITFPRRCYIVTGPQAVSIRGLRLLVQALGGIPLPSGLRGMKPFFEALACRIGQGCAVTIYPEAHIWPYYTDIRPFPAGSFAYPIRCGVPVVPFVVTYRKRRIFKHAKPLITVQVGSPLLPDEALDEREARQQLRDAAYAWMKQTADAADQPEYIRYIYKN